MKKKIVFLLSLLFLCAVFSGCIELTPNMENPTNVDSDYRGEDLDINFRVPERGDLGTIEINPENLATLLSTVRRPSEYQLSFWVTYHANGIYQRTSGKQYVKDNRTLIRRYGTDGDLWFSVLNADGNISIKYDGGESLQKSGEIFDAEGFANMPDIDALIENAEEITLRRPSYEETGDEDVVEIEISYNDTNIYEKLRVSLSSGMILRCESYVGEESTPYYAFAVDNLEKKIDAGIDLEKFTL